MIGLLLLFVGAGPAATDVLESGRAHRGRAGGS